MHSRIALFFITLVVFVLAVAANPVPANPDAAVVKKALKQFDMRAAAEAKRDDEHFKPKPKPSKVYRAAEPAPTDEHYKPKPSKYYRRAEEYKPKPSRVYRAEARAPTA